MAQILLIGLGGTGSRVVSKVAKELDRNEIDINNGEICCAVLDTNKNDNEKLSGIPVYPTSKAMKIRKYFEKYHSSHIGEWSPTSPEFLEQSMIDGASEHRVKSRIAFMDSYKTKVIKDLENKINQVLKHNYNSKIRVMIVSSLSGGTGSGMFIQVALWLRKYLSQSEITIRGIFLLPDVFIHTITDIRENDKSWKRHYCNAYAAIRELNTLSKIYKNDLVELTEEIKLDDLFDSSKDINSGKHVYDFAFFIDDMDQCGVRLDTITDYENMVAQLVYMQLFAPMASEMYSEEDNTFLAFSQKEEPLYGSCGTSKAVYPTENVKEYCELRAAQDSLKGGWKKIDSEINAIKKEREEAERNGIFNMPQLDTQEEYIRIFDQKITVKEDEAGSDRFFLRIANDIKNETNDNDLSGEPVILYTDKVDDFYEELISDKIDAEITKNSGTEAYLLGDTFKTADHDIDQLIRKVKNDELGMEGVLSKFEQDVDTFADNIINLVFPYDMGNVNPNNKCTIYGLLTKTDNKESVFIHPVAARYVIYKLIKTLDRALDSINLKSSKASALAGGKIVFDNKKTKNTENTPMEYLQSKTKYQNVEKFTDYFEELYVQYINTKINLCEKYEKELLEQRVYRGLKKRLNMLAKQFEYFFNCLGDAQNSIESAIKENIKKTNFIDCKTKYVLGDKDSKEAIYNALDFELDRSDVNVNKSVVDSVYGSVCAKVRPDNDNNKKYKDISLVDSFTEDMRATYRKRMDDNVENKKLVELNICSAISKERDLKYKDETYDSVLNRYIEELHSMAAPFLVYDDEIINSEAESATTHVKTFWGMAPKIVELYPDLESKLNVNLELQSSKAYAINELCCYRAVYGLEAVYIPKFNESKDGDYYKYYNYTIEEILRKANDRHAEHALMNTPHLDKRWHNILPYVTKQKNSEENLKFYHGFWLAVAYGKLSINNEGNFCIARKVDAGYGNSIETDEVIIYKGDNIAKTNVKNLIAALKSDMVFTHFDIPELEKRFARETKGNTTYVGTDVLKGLTTKNDDFNPVVMISRYHESNKNSIETVAILIGSLEKIAEELAAGYSTNRSAQKANEAKYKICKKIYDSSERVKGKSAAFKSWNDAFKKYNIKEEA